MKVVTLENAVVNLIPRSYPAIEDTITLSLRQEGTGSVINPSFNILTKQGYFSFEITDLSELVIRERYELEVLKNSETIYLGVVVYLDSNTDVQNYEPQKQSNKIWV